MQFKIKTMDPFLLGRARLLCMNRGRSLDALLELAVRDAITEVRTREGMENGASHLRAYPTQFPTRDPDIARIAELSQLPMSKWDSRGFDIVIIRKLERRLALCEAGVLSLS